MHCNSYIMKTILTNNGITRIFKTNAKLGMSVYYIQLKKSPSNINVNDNINYNILPTHLPNIYKLIINKTNDKKEDILYFNE